MQRARFSFDGGLRVEAILCAADLWLTLPEASDPTWRPVWLEYVVLALRLRPDVSGCPPEPRSG